MDNYDLQKLADMQAAVLWEQVKGQLRAIVLAKTIHTYPGESDKDCKERNDRIQNTAERFIKKFDECVIE